MGHRRSLLVGIALLSSGCGRGGRCGPTLPAGRDLILRSETTQHVIAPSSPMAAWPAINVGPISLLVPPAWKIRPSGEMVWVVGGSGSPHSLAVVSLDVEAATVAPYGAPDGVELTIAGRRVVWKVYDDNKPAYWAVILECGSLRYYDERNRNDWNDILASAATAKCC